MKSIVIVLVMLAFTGIALASSGSEAKAPEETKPGIVVPKDDKTGEGIFGKWIRFPTITGKDLETKERVNFAPIPGFVSVVVFTASYCTACQDMMDDLVKIEKKYSKLYTRFIYVFSHDTFADAAGARKEFNIKKAILADTLEGARKEFHEPELPTIYVGDRHGWLLTRYKQTSLKDLEKLDNLLKYLTVY